jgi:hypothetical protein
MLVPHEFQNSCATDRTLLVLCIVNRGFVIEGGPTPTVKIVNASIKHTLEMPRRYLENMCFLSR